MECESTVFEVVPECKEGEANEKTQRSAKVRYHGYKIITVNLNACYIDSTRTTDLIGLVWFKEGARNIWPQKIYGLMGPLLIDESTNDLEFSWRGVLVAQEVLADQENSPSYLLFYTDCN